MATYRRVYDSRHLQADCQQRGSAPEPYARCRIWDRGLPFYPGIIATHKEAGHNDQMLFGHFPLSGSKSIPGLISFAFLVNSGDPSC